MVLERDTSKGENLERVKENLLDIGYYRLGFYWYPFEKICPNCKQHKSNHKFYKERNQSCIECNKHMFEVSSNFFDAIDLYYLDWDLKHLLNKYINRIEVNFRTRLIYNVSNRYKQSPNWFMDSKIVTQNFINILPKYYNKKFKQNNRAIGLHHQKYINDKYAPAWKTIEFFNFGNSIEIYENLRDSDLKEEISSKYKLKSPKVLINFLHSVRSIRNVCAHGGVLFDYKLRTRIKRVKGMCLTDCYSLYSCIQIILFLLETISYNRKNNLESDLKELFSKYKNNLVIKNIILNAMKFEEKFLK